ncbi:MAG: formylglycine-generating enzyme family protein [Bythopirellula sp.]
MAGPTTPLAYAKEQAQGTERRGMVADKPTDQRSVATDNGYMVAYSERIPGTDIEFEMIPIPGGEFLLGSPDAEADRRSDEGPQVRVVVEPYWIGKCEITWAEYQAFMDTYSALKSLHELRVEVQRFGAESEQLSNLPNVKDFLTNESLDIDGVTAPTPLYEPDVTYAYGQDSNQPAVTMSQFGAKQYTKWLSGITQSEYRLPTEAEWEYAARAGSNTPYAFAPNESLDDYAWYDANSDDQLQAVGTKLPNAWGVHDMHGNVAEWVLDEYDAEHYSSIADKSQALDAVRWPEKLYPRVIRGGYWFDDPAQCRSAARHQSDDPEWTVSDPNLPVSPWWLTEDPASGIGFRLVRPRTPMGAAVKKKVWDADIEEIRLDVADRLEEGRGTISGADPRLPAALQELESAGLID